MKLCFYKTRHVLQPAVEPIVQVVCASRSRDRRYSLWNLLQAEKCQIASMCVPLLIHCLTHPTGADVFWKLVEDDFNSDNWKVRFSAGNIDYII